MRESRELFLRIKYKYPNAKEFEMRDGTKQIIFDVFIVVYQKIRYKELYSLIIKNDTIQNEKTPEKIWNVIKQHRNEKTDRKSLTERLFKM